MTSLQSFQTQILMFEADWPLSLPETAMEGMSEEELITLYQTKDGRESEEAFKEIYNRTSRELWRNIRSRCASDAAAKDIWGKTWSIILEQLDSFQWEGKPLIGWMTRIANIKRWEYFRIEPSDLAPEEVATNALSYIDAELARINEDPHPEATYPKPGAEVAIQTKAIILQTMKKLSLNDQKILTLVVINGLNAAEAAKKLGISHEAAKKRKQRALTKLQNRLGAEL